VNPRKAALLSADERVAVIREAFDDDGVPADLRDRVDVTAFEGLTVDFARAQGGRWVVRGLRAVSDFELEMQLAQTNRVLASGVDAVFFMTALEHGYVSSTLAKEIASFGGDVSALVPPAAARALASRFRAPEQVR
jgi:pantetheine-phosphate adenylyltransferase